MKRTRTRNKRVKGEGINTNEELRSVRHTVIRWNGRGQTTVGSSGICCLLTIYTFEW